ncbi:MAG: ATP-binding protein [Verrucomicrobiota bacterium]|nr:ATP-binding protein [Verrucomicrobiota bacterium]
MKFAAFIPLAGAICNLLLGIFVLSRGEGAKVNRVYFFVGTAIAVWNFGSFELFLAQTHDAALFWARFLQFGVIFLPALFFHLSLLMADYKVSRAIVGFYAFLGILACSNLTSFFIKEVRVLGGSGWYAVAGPGFHIYSLAFTATVLSILLLIKKRRQLPQLHKARLSPLIFAQILLLTLGTNDILPIIGIERYPFTDTYVYPFGSLAAIFYGIVVGYSVLQHQILDVQVALSRVVAHVVRLSFLFLIGLGLLLAMTVFAPGKFNAVSFLGALGVLMASSLIASIYFPRLFGSGTDSLEKRILGDRFEYHDQIRSFVDSMQWYNDTNLLMSDLQELFLKTIRIRSYQIILLDETSRIFSLFRAFPDDPTQQLPELNSQSPVFRFFELTKAEYMSFSSGSQFDQFRDIERAARIQLGVFGPEFCFPMSFEGELFGLLLTGEKNSNEPYTSTDVSLLSSLVKNLSLVINQIRLKNQVLHAQELELLGRMSRGMAHDLNNLLTPIWTFLQLSSEGIPLADMGDDLGPVAMRNLKTVRSYIREALFFSENLRPDFQRGRLDILLEQAIDLMADRRDQKGVRIETDSPGEVLVEMDEVLIQRLIGNVIANAIDASPAGSTIRAEIQRLNKAQAKRDWLRIRVIDSGDGIREEDLVRVMTPYFTTKNRGDESRGFGLGLAICRKIANLHGGNLTIASELHKGTTVQLDLPATQLAPAAKPMRAQVA